MKAYYYDDQPGDQRLPHDGGRSLTPSDLAALGVQHFSIQSVDEVEALAQERGYHNRDECTISPMALGSSYEDKMRTFFAEHLHEDEEIRFVRGGRGFFDVRDRADRWVRIRVAKGDLLILPAGIYHRFTTDESDYIHCMRLFKDEPKWTPLNRSSEVDQNQCRKEYLAEFLAAA